MYRTALYFVLIAATCLFAAGFSDPGTPAEAPSLPFTTAQDTFDQSKALALLREEIKGKEKLPAETVFKNIQTLKGVPAGRILAIMEMGYSRSLGVTCTHCHNPEAWDSEEKPAKQITREMAAMAKTINSELLAKIQNLESASPVVNCTTCHRGHVKPATSLD